MKVITTPLGIQQDFGNSLTWKITTTNDQSGGVWTYSWYLVYKGGNRFNLYEDLYLTQRKSEVFCEFFEFDESKNMLHLESSAGIRAAIVGYNRHYTQVMIYADSIAGDIMNANIPSVVEKTELEEEGEWSLF